MKTIPTILYAVILFGNQASHAASTTLFSTIGSPETGALANIAENLSHAIQITTGGQAIQLDSILIKVQSDSTIHTTLYSEAGGQPDAPLQSFNPATGNPSIPTLTEFNIGAPVILDPNTNYFIVVNAPEATFAGWRLSVTPVVSGSGDLIGNTQRIYQVNDGPWNIDTGHLLIYSISGQIVPEPTGTTLGAIGMLLLLRRRR